MFPLPNHCVLLLALPLVSSCNSSSTCVYALRVCVCLYLIRHRLNTRITIKTSRSSNSLPPAFVAYWSPSVTTSYCSVILLCWDLSYFLLAVALTYRKGNKVTSKIRVDQGISTPCLQSHSWLLACLHCSHIKSYERQLRGYDTLLQWYLCSEVQLVNLNNEWPTILLTYSHWTQVCPVGHVLIWS